MGGGRSIAPRGGDYTVKKPLLDVATMAMQINLAKGAQELDGPVQKEVRTLVA